MTPTDVCLSFWSQAFDGATPPEALVLALENGLVPASLLAEHQHDWLSGWLKGQANRMTDAYDLAHRPWRQFGGAGRDAKYQQDLPPRLSEAARGDRSLGLAAVLLAFGDAGVSWDAPLKKPLNWAPSLLSAAVAMNLPVVFDALAKKPTRPASATLDAQWTPMPVLGERAPLPWLHAAARGWHDSMLEALLDYGLDPNARDTKGQTALFHARTPRAIKALLQAGADPTLVDKNKRSALQAWKQANDLPARHSAEDLESVLEAVMPAAAKPSQDGAAQAASAVLYLGDKPPFQIEGIEKWAKGSPSFEGPLHAARMNPGGSFKGEWSPAAWVGLKGLQDGLFYKAHVSYLLGCNDFLSPEDHSPKNGLSERGLLGLALLAARGNEPVNKPHPATIAKPNENDQQRWEMVVAMEKRLGEGWHLDPKWVEPMLATTKALLTPKSTSNAMRENVEKAWANRAAVMRRAKQDWEAGLVEARLRGGLRFDFEPFWNDVLSNLSESYRPMVNLFFVADALTANDRARHPSADDGVLDYGNGRRAWVALNRHLEGKADIEVPDPAFLPMIEDALDRLSKVPSAVKGVAVLKAKIFDRRWQDGATPTAPKPRF